MIKMSRKAKKAMAVALTAGMLASTAATPVMAATAGWKQNAKGWWYENADGTYPANKWQSINGKWYYFDANGYMVSGWKSINGKWYYFGDANDGAMKSGWKSIGGKWYYLGEAGDGSMKDGWFKDYTGKYSYAKPGDGAIYQDAWQLFDGEWYYLDGKGYMQEGGWVDNAGNRYFVDENGIMQSGIVKIEDAIYYFGDSNDGSLKTGEQVIGEVTYKFDASGKAVGDVIPTATKAFKEDGTPVALTPEERDLSISGATAITKNTAGNFVFTVLLSETATAAELNDTKLTLTNGSIVVTASFDSVDGATAVYKIDDASKLTPGDTSANGKYAVTANGIDVDTDVYVSYEETLVGNAIQGIVYYYDVADAKYKGIEGATVTVDGKSATTDENGCYNISATTGVKDVEVTADGYFGKKATNVVVSKNYLTSQNVLLETYEQEKLYIEGTVLNAEDLTKKVSGAKVIASWAKVEQADRYLVEVLRNGKKVKSEYTTGLTYTYKNAKAGYAYTVKVTPAIQYDGTVYVGETKKANYIVKPATPNISVKKNKTTVTVASKKQAATGYQIQICKSKKFKSGVKKYTVKSTSLKKTIKLTSLKKGTNYIRIRAYKTYEGKTAYSKWSTVKKVNR